MRVADAVPLSLWTPPAQAPVRIRTWFFLARDLGDEVHIRVDDDGPGIDPAQREAIFRRFHSERPDGEAFGRHSGLGLAIARTIIEGHAGTVSARDREDGRRGASLLITLPARDGSGEAG